MNITPISSNNFKGYDVRPLKGFIMTCNPANIASEMKTIGEKEGFKIYSFAGDTFGERVGKKCKQTPEMWAQDRWNIIKNKLQFSNDDSLSEKILQFFHLVPDEIQMQKRKSPWFFQELAKEHGFAGRILGDTHITGGTSYIAKNKDGVDNLLIGDDETYKYSTENLQQMFGVQKVIPLPLMDYHIDLFIRPLDNGRVLLADDNLTVKVLEDGYMKLSEYVNALPKSEQSRYNKTLKHMKDYIGQIKDIKHAMKYNHTEEIKSILESNGYDVIRVPGRICSEAPFIGEDFLSFQRDCNYINAIVVKNNNGDLVYITNKSDVDTERLGLTKELSEKIGFSFEDAFIKSLSPYIDKERIYFIDGDDNYVSKTMLKHLYGGVHCLCAEVPLE